MIAISGAVVAFIIVGVVAVAIVVWLISRQWLKARDFALANPVLFTAAHAAQLASALTASTALRAKLFGDPGGRIGRRLPPHRHWKYTEASFWHPHLRRNARRDAATLTLLAVAASIADQKITSAINTDEVFEEFFAPIVKSSQRSFSSVMAMSGLAFLAGLGLIAAGVVLAFHKPDDGGNSTAIATIFGATGALSSLGSVFAMAKSGIRQAASDHARVRLVLTAFATQLGQLRSLAERPAAPNAPAAPFATMFSEIGQINAGIAVALANATSMLKNSDSGLD